MTVFSIITAALLMLNFMRLCGAQKHPVRAMAINSAAGLAALCIAAAVSGLLGKGLAVNPASAALAASLGVPGVIMLLLLLFVI